MAPENEQLPPLPAAAGSSHLLPGPCRHSHSRFQPFIGALSAPNKYNTLNPELRESCTPEAPPITPAGQNKLAGKVWPANGQASSLAGQATAAGLAHADLKCILVLWSPCLCGPWPGHLEGWAGGSRRSHCASSGHRGSGSICPFGGTATWLDVLRKSCHRAVAGSQRKGLRR